MIDVPWKDPAPLRTFLDSNKVENTTSQVNQCKITKDHYFDTHVILCYSLLRGANKATLLPNEVRGSVDGKAVISSSMDLSFDTMKA